MSDRPSPRLVALGSGSGGNAYAVTDGATLVVVDCGFSAREISRRLRLAHLDPADVCAIFITHEHSDHIRGLEVFCRRHATSAVVYASCGTRRAGGLDDVAAEVVSVRVGDPVSIGTLEVVAFSASHDAAEPVGYRIARGTRAVGIATDTGLLTEEAFEALAGCGVVGLESNHDIEMLANGPYPAFLKRRIRSPLGHLSNGDAADAIERLAHDGLMHVIALHRSRTNNTQRLAGAQLKARLERIGLGRVPVTVAAQDAVCESDPPQGRLFDAG